MSTLAAMHKKKCSNQKITAGEGVIHGSVADVIGYDNAALRETRFLTMSMCPRLAAAIKAVEPFIGQRLFTAAPLSSAAFSSLDAPALAISTKHIVQPWRSGVCWRRLRLREIPLSFLITTLV